MIRFGPVLLALGLAGCFFGHDHEHGHGGHGHEPEELPDQVTVENAEKVLEQSLRRVSGSGVGDGAVYVPWRTSVEGRRVVAGIERRSVRAGLEGSWTRIPFQKVRKVEVAPPSQGGLKLWSITFTGESVVGAGTSPSGETSTPFSIVSSDGEAVRALASSVERIRKR